MASKLGNTFVYTEKYFDTINMLDEQTKMKVNWDLCYYGTHNKTMPEDASPISLAIISAFDVLIQGSIDYNEKKQEEGKKGGPKVKFTDDEIIDAYKTLYKQKGSEPTEQEVIAYCGGGVKRIAARPIWQNRKKYLYECMNEQTEDTYKNTNIHTKTFDF